MAIDQRVFKVGGYGEKFAIRKQPNEKYWLEVDATDWLNATQGAANSGSIGVAGSATIQGTNTGATVTVTTQGPHGFTTGDLVTIAGSNSTPSLDGSGKSVTVVSPTTFTVTGVTVTVAGTAAGTVVKTSGGGWTAWTDPGANAPTVVMQSVAAAKACFVLTGGTTSWNTSPTAPFVANQGQAAVTLIAPNGEKKVIYLVVSIQDIT